MDLVEAFYRLGFREGSAREASDRQEQAAKLLLGVLKAMSGRLVPDPDVRDELVSRTLYKLLRGGPRRRPEPPPTEGSVRGYLWTALRNNWLTLVDASRRERLMAQKLDAIPTAQTPPLQDRKPDFERALERLGDVAGSLKERLRSDAAAGLERSVDEMIALLRGNIDFDELVEASVGQAPTEVARVRARAALHQRHTRTRKRLLDHIDALRDEGVLRPDEADMLGAVVDALRSRRPPRSPSSSSSSD